MERKNQIGFEIKVISNLIQRKIDSTASGRGLAKLTPMQGWIIDYIYNNQNKSDIFQRDVETEFTIRRSTATGILKLMEKNGLITRIPVGFDARLKKLVLTKEAIAFHEKIVLEIEKIEAQISKGLTEQERTSFFTIMEKIKRNIE